MNQDHSHRKSSTVNDTKTISFAMDAAGMLRAIDFKPRSLKKVIESELGDDLK